VISFTQFEETSREGAGTRPMDGLREKGVIRFTQSVETSHKGAGARPVEVYHVNQRDSYVAVGFSSI
jgi:hypothetical protein